MNCCGRRAAKETAGEWRASSSGREHRTILCRLQAVGHGFSMLGWTTQTARRQKQHKVWSFFPLPFSPVPMHIPPCPPPLPLFFRYAATALAIRQIGVRGRYCYLAKTSLRKQEVVAALAMLKAGHDHISAVGTEAGPVKRLGISHDAYMFLSDWKWSAPYTFLPDRPVYLNPTTGAWEPLTDEELPSFCRPTETSMPPKMKAAMKEGHGKNVVQVGSWCLCSCMLHVPLPVPCPRCSLIFLPRGFG